MHSQDVKPNAVGIFPFGHSILEMAQKDRTRKHVFVLGVYASAVHARWVGEDGRQKIGAVAVASEPEIFWRGDNQAAQAIITAINLPAGAGRLVPASAQLNGPSGKALDEKFLRPLGLSRADTWLCDLVTHSCMNGKQALALRREYDPLQVSLGLPAYEWPLLPDELADERRRSEIEAEILESGAELLITLGDQPLRWFAQFYGSAAKLLAYGQTASEYGRLHPLSVAGRDMKLLPLVHPRQAARLGRHSAGWAAVHQAWITTHNQPQAEDGGAR